MSPIEERIAQTLAEGKENVASRCGIKGLTEGDVREGKTPEEIAKRWLARRLSQSTDKAIFEQEELEAEQKCFPLLPYSQLVYEMEQQTPGVYTFPIVLQYDEAKIDTHCLNEAIQTAIVNHPVFRGNEQYYALYAEDGLLNVSMNRILGDGYSFGLLLEDICKAYQGLPLEPDYYFRYLQQVEDHKQTKEYAEHKRQLEAHFEAVDGCSVPVHPSLDKEIAEYAEWLAGEYVQPIDQPLDNETVCLATAIAIMDYCGTNEAALTWAYLGRENEQERHIFGSLHKDIPMRICRADTKEEYRRQMKEEMQQGIRLSDYPYTLTNPQHEVWRYAANVLQQGRLEDDTHGLAFNLDTTSIPPRYHSEGRPLAYSLLDIEIEDHQLRLKYSATHYRETSIIRFAELIKKNIIWLRNDL